MPSPTCLVNSTSTVDGVDVTASSTVTIQLESLSGVNVWSISCIGTDETSVAATINSSLVINTTTKTATFTAPGTGTSLIFQSKINNGIRNSSSLEEDPDYTTTFGIYVLSTLGVRVGAVNETTEGSSSYGWVTKINPVLRGSVSIPASGTAGGDLSGTYPNPSVAKIHGATVPIAGALTTGNVPQVSGVSAISYGPVNLAGGSNYVTGSLPTANQVAQSLGGDLSGTTASATVSKANGSTVPAGGSLTTGNVLQVSGASALSYGALNLAGGANYVTGTLPTGNQASQALGGDASGTTAAVTNIKINGATVPIAGSLTTGNLIQVSGASALSYGALNLAGGSNYVSGLLPTANQASQTMGGDISGTTASATVTKIQSFAVSSATPKIGDILVWDGSSWVPGDRPVTADSAQTTWFINPGGSGSNEDGAFSAGSDSNTGYDRTHPLQTLAAWLRRVYGANYTGTVTVDILGDIPDSDPLFLTVSTSGSGILKIKGHLTVVFSGTVTTWTAQADATNTAASILDSGRSALWSTDGWTNQMLVQKTVAGSPVASTWGVSDAGSKTMWVGPSTAIVSESTTFSFAEYTAWANGDTYQVGTLTRLPTVVTTRPCNVEINRFKLSAPASSIYAAACPGSYIKFRICCETVASNSTYQGSQIDFYNCAFVGGGLTVVTIAMNVYACSIIGQSQGFGSGCRAFVNVGCHLQNARLGANAGGSLQLLSHLGCFGRSSSSGALRSEIGALPCSINSNVYGTGNTGTSMVLNAGSQWYYAAATNFYWSWTTEINFGGLTRKFVDLPLHNGAHGEIFALQTTNTRQIGTEVGLLSLSVAGSANVTLTSAQYRYGSYKFTGVLTGNINVIYPNETGVPFSVINSTTGIFTLTVIGTSGTGISIVSGTNQIIEFDGTNMVSVSIS